MSWGFPRAEVRAVPANDAGRRLGLAAVLVQSSYASRAAEMPAGSRRSVTNAGVMRNGWGEADAATVKRAYRWDE